MSNKAALITGASKRIGLFCARSCAKLGYDIALHYHAGQKDAEQAKKELETRFGVQVKLIQADLSDPNAIETVFLKAHNSLPTLSLLINSASLFGKESIIDSTASSVVSQFSLNVIAPFLLTSAFAKRVGNGHIINISDAKKHHPERSVYNTSKLALEAFTEQAAKELAPTIRVNTIALGSFLPPSTPPSQPAINDTPLIRMGTEEDLFKAIAFLDAAHYVTGDTLHIDGGRHLR